jgi:hypothetical protein
MRIVDLAVEGIGGLPDGTYSFAGSSGVPADVTLVAGEAGSGKTRLLEAIIAAKESVGSWGSGARFGTLKRSNASRAAIVARWILSPSECDEGRLTTTEFTTTSTIDEKGNTPTDSPIGLKRVFQAHDEAGLARFGYLHGERGWPSYEVPEAQAFTMLAADNRKFGHLLPKTFDLLAEDQESAARTAAEGGLSLPGARSHLTDLREALRPFLSRHALASFARHGGDRELVFQTRRGDSIPGSALSGSERHALLVALDTILNHRRSGLMLVDEPELHRHPLEHVPFFDAYRELLRGTQIIAATSSPSLLRAASDWAQIIQLPTVGK